VQYVGQVLQKRIPIMVEESFEEAGEEVKLRGTLFPLSGDGETIDAILGAANCARLEALKLKHSAA